MILSLTDCCRESVAQAMRHRLVDEEVTTTSQDLLYDFIVDSCLPRNVLLSILKAFILSMDRGLVHFSGRLIDCSCNRATCRREACGETKHSRDCNLYWINRNDKDTSFRTMALTRHCVNVVMAIWHEKHFSPSCLIEDSLPIGLSLRMRQWILTYSVEGFLKSHNICQSAFPKSECRSHVACEKGLVHDQRCSKCSLRHHQDELRWNESMTSFYRQRGVKKRPAILDLRTSKGTFHCTRSALSALKVGLEKVNNSDIMTSLFMQPTSPDKENDVITIKLEVAVVGSMHDWFSDVLLTVLRKARTTGLRIDLSAIRFEDVAPQTVNSIIRNLSSPKEVRRLHFKHVDPLSLLEAKDSLRLLTGTEEFSIATCDFQPVHFNSDETSTLWGDVIGSWPKIRTLEFSGVRMSFNEIDNNNNHLVNLPRSLRSLELADESVTSDVLIWLIRQFQKAGNEEIFCGDSKTFSLQALRVVREASLSRQSQMWLDFLKLINQLKHTLQTLSVDHCNLTNRHAMDILEFLKPGDNSEFASSLRRITLREPHVTWKTTSQLFDVILSSSSKHLFNPNKNDKTLFNFPELSYFSAMVPKASDPTISDLSNVKVDPYFFTTNWTENPRSHFEDKLIELATFSGRSRIDVELIWEPECDWT